jgi:enoyl-CoA hydratase
MGGRVRFDSAVDGGMLTIRFDHAPTRNALDRETRVALVEALAQADADAEVRAIVLTGTGTSFSSGVDAKQLLGDPAYVAPPIDPPSMLRRIRTPTIAAVNGACVSGGLEIALACSVIIASDAATFADTHAKLGLSPGWGLSVELPAAIGAHRARQLTLTALPIDARTACGWGLVNEVVPADRLEGRVQELAAAIVALPAAAVANAVSLYRATHEAIQQGAREARPPPWPAGRWIGRRAGRPSLRASRRRRRRSPVR